MARVLYGVMGNTHGHVMRSLAIAERLRDRHEFHFLGGGRVPAAVAARGFPVTEVPVLRTVHKAGRVSVPAVIGQIVGRIAEAPDVLRRVRALVEEFKPDVAICDREFYLPLACRRAGLRCVSLDHSHVMRMCRYPVPPGQRVSWALAMLNDYLLFDFTRHNLAVSFFHPPRRAGVRGVNELLPPVLRPEVTGVTPGEGEHVLVYQTSATFRPLLEPLRQLDRPVLVYGFGEGRSEGNLQFRPYDERAILRDLASCAYAVVNGGHNLLCEAFHFKKPALCFPIATLFEQFINAWHVRELGYGTFSTDPRPGKGIFEAFERELDRFRANLAAQAGTFDGTARVVERVRGLIAGQ